MAKRHAIYSREDTRHYNYCIRREDSREHFDMKLHFLDGEKLGDLDFYIDDAQTKRKVRRILEKRAAQRYWADKEYRGHAHTRRIKRDVHAELKYIFGTMPAAFPSRWAA